MTVKSVLMRPQGLCPRARAPTCPSCYVTARAPGVYLLATPLVRMDKGKFFAILFGRPLWTAPKNTRLIFAQNLRTN